MKHAALETIGNALILVVACMAVHAASAAPIPVNNPGFEEDILGNGSTSHSIAGWSTTAGGGDGAFNPPSTSYVEGTIPGGDNIAYTNSPDNHVNQVLAAVLETGYLYTLQVEVGNRLNENFVGYNLQLRAGGVIVAEDSSTVFPAPGTFATATLTFIADQGNPQLGQPLEIWLTSPGVQANFDNVRIDRTMLGVPPVVELPFLGLQGVLVLLALIGLAGAVRIRRHAVDRQEAALGS